MSRDYIVRRAHCKRTIGVKSQSLQSGGLFRAWSDLESSLDDSAAVVVFGERHHSVGQGVFPADAMQHPPLLSRTRLFEHFLDHIVAEGVLHEHQHVLLHLVDDAGHLQSRRIKSCSL